MGAERFGVYYFCVKTTLSESGEIYVHADSVSIAQGALVFLGHQDIPVLVIALGDWSACFAASVLDGSAVAVPHWKGEVTR